MLSGLANDREGLIRYPDSVSSLCRSANSVHDTLYFIMDGRLYRWVNGMATISQPHENTIVQLPSPELILSCAAIPVTNVAIGTTKSYLLTGISLTSRLLLMISL